MNIASNPWSFTPTDCNTATIVASPGGLTLNVDGSVTLTLSGAFSQADLVANNKLTIYQPANLAYQGFYRVRTVTDSTHYNIIPENFKIPAGTAASGDGTAAKCQYTNETRIEDLSWQNTSALGQLLTVVDKNGFPVWFATSSGPGQQNRGKVFWVSGLVIIEMDSGILLATVN